MTIVTFEEGDESPKIRYTDNGDGSYTPIVDVGATITVSGGGLTDGELRASPISVISPNVDSDSVLSGQITVAAAGTAVQGTNIALSNGVYVKALAANTGKGYVGNDGAGDITSANGFELAAGDVVIIQVANLNELWFDAATNGDKFCWIKA